MNSVAPSTSTTSSSTVEARRPVQQRTVQAGEMIFCQGGIGDVAYLIKSGRIQIFREDGRILATIGPGAIFGEMALIDNQPRMASARAVEPSTLIVVSAGTLQEKLSRADPFVRGLVSILTRNLRTSTNLLS